MQHCPVLATYIPGTSNPHLSKPTSYHYLTATVFALAELTPSYSFTVKVMYRVAIGGDYLIHVMPFEGHREVSDLYGTLSGQGFTIQNPFYGAASLTVSPLQRECQQTCRYQQLVPTRHIFVLLTLRERLPRRLRSDFPDTPAS